MSPKLSDFVLKTLCQNQGCLDYKRLCLEIQQSNGATDEILRSVLDDSSRFVMAQAKNGMVLGSDPSPDTAIVAKTSLRVCQSLEQDCDSCGNLHLCRYFVNGLCKYRNNCKHTHDLDSYHNTVLLTRDGLMHLDQVELFQLLLQNDTSLLPNICSYYNAGRGEHGSCNFKTQCKNLHICKHFFQDSCKFGAMCTRSHRFDDRAKKILKGWGLSADNQLILQKIYRNRFIISRSVKKSDETIQTEAVGDSSTSVIPIPEPSKEICLFFLQGKCRSVATCRYLHCPLPYKWEMLDSDGVTWKDVPNQEDVEMAYCNPGNDFSMETPPINFLTMTCESAKVRRLSTPSSVRWPPTFPLTTEWLWFWRNDKGRWIEFGTEVRKSVPSATSQMVEEVYLEHVNGSFPISVGNKTCILNCRDMYLLSDEDEAKVVLRRRPRFRSAKPVEEKLNSTEVSMGLMKAAKPPHATGCLRSAKPVMFLIQRKDPGPEWNSL